MLYLDVGSYKLLEHLASGTNLHRGTCKTVLNMSNILLLIMTTCWF